MSSYEEYRDMISRIDGKPIDEEARAKAREEAGITTINYRVNREPDDMWSGTLFLVHGEPIMLAYYVWKVSLENILWHLEVNLGYPVELVHERQTGGNGHYNVPVRRKKESGA